MSRITMSFQTLGARMYSLSSRTCSLNGISLRPLICQRHVIPGLTCLWQIKGRSEIPFKEQVRLDKEYILAPSVWKDIVILLKTIPAIVGGKGAY